MSLLPRKAVLAVAAVIDIAQHGRERLVSAKDLAVRLNLPTRHLEPVLQSLVRRQVLEGVRGPRGGYRLARQHSRVTVIDIVHAVEPAGMNGNSIKFGSNLVEEIVLPAIEQAEKTFSHALGKITVESLMHRVKPLHGFTTEGR